MHHLKGRGAIAGYVPTHHDPVLDELVSNHSCFLFLHLTFIFEL